MFVFNVADYLLDEILNRDQAVNTAEFIDHKRHMQPLNTHLQQKFQNRHRRRNKERVADDLADPSFLTAFPAGQQVLDVQHANNIIEFISEHRQS